MVDFTGITIIDTILIALISGIVGFVPTYLSAILKFRKDLESEYDKDLRQNRINVYQGVVEEIRTVSKIFPS